ncbi:MAG: class I SAM-dependent methyltransferase [Anaerolineales bacterium]|jgi:hypothetical protein
MGDLSLQSTVAAWEVMWAPYDEATYRSVLECIRKKDVIVDIGAGDLRLALRMAQVCRKVYAIEIQECLLNIAIKKGHDQFPGNIVVIQGDARRVQFPPDVTAGVLLMRHCTHFQLYANKLREIGAERLITNARWRMGVEVIQLAAERIPFYELNFGWYACWCGHVGFKPGPVERLIPRNLDVTYEVIHCPHCQG